MGHSQDSPGLSRSFGFRRSVLGLARAIAATRSLRSFVFEVSTIDSPVLVLAAVAVLLLALLAALPPALRTASVDPMLALRSE
jgi:ABC-type lipoprotein release transport system permease subunit